MSSKSTHRDWQICWGWMRALLVLWVSIFFRESSYLSWQGHSWTHILRIALKESTISIQLGSSNQFSLTTLRFLTPCCMSRYKNPCMHGVSKTNSFCSLHQSLKKSIQSPWTVKPFIGIWLWKIYSFLSFKNDTERRTSRSICFYTWAIKWLKKAMRLLKNEFSRIIRWFSYWLSCF